MSVTYEETRLVHALQRLCEPDESREARRDGNIATAIATGLLMTAVALAAAKLTLPLLAAIWVIVGAMAAFFWNGWAPGALFGFGSVQGLFENARRQYLSRAVTS